MVSQKKPHTIGYMKALPSDDQKQVKLKEQRMKSVDIDKVINQSACDLSEVLERLADR